MIDLLQNYSLEQVFIFIVVISLAIKGCVTFYDWAVKRVRQMVHDGEKPDKLQEKIQSHDQEIRDIKQMIKDIMRKIDILVNSDKDAIKAYITKQHHYFCYDQKWIDDHSLECIERRFTHYKEEGGNSFISTLMEEIRTLPKQPKEGDEDNKASSSGNMS